jgi:hypothetical protein
MGDEAMLEATVPRKKEKKKNMEPLERHIS